MSNLARIAVGVACCGFLPITPRFAVLGAPVDLVESLPLGLDGGFDGWMRLYACPVVLADREREGRRVLVSSVFVLGFFQGRNDA